MKKIRNIGEFAMLAGMVITLFAHGVCVNAQTRTQVSEDVFRLHVIANSDSDVDQALKIKVRDAVLEAGGGIFGGSENADDAAEAAELNLEVFNAAARKVLRENGCEHSVECEVADVWFDERAYGSAVLPEGEYKALRVKIGRAEGRNWWCVMFPPLCLPAVTNTDEVLAEAESDGVLTSAELDMIKDPDSYEVRFYFIDKINELAEYLESRSSI